MIRSRSLLRRFRCVRTPIDLLDAHPLHQRCHMEPTDIEVLANEEVAQVACMLGVLLSWLSGSVWGKRHG